jgi:hypothetical protein
MFASSRLSPPRKSQQRITKAIRMPNPLDRKLVNLREKLLQVENVGVEEVERVETSTLWTSTNRGLHVKNTALRIGRTFSFERGELCGSFPGARQRHRRHLRDPCMQ